MLNMMNEKTLSGFRLEPIKDLGTLGTIGYEVLTVLPSGVCPELYFSNISSMDMISLFADQVEYCLSTDSQKKYFINLSVSVLANPVLCASLPLVPDSHKICIELQDPQNLRRMKRAECISLEENVRDLRKKGYQVWLDDVTTSLVGLTSALDIQFDGIKIDKSEILAPDSRPEELIALIKQCKKHTSQVLVEGIETRSLLDLCINAGAKMGQGYMWKKEMLFV